MATLRRVCVFCGSSTGAKPEYLEAAQQIGRMLADEGVELVYGGASVGLMVAAADAALAAGGDVTGVMPEMMGDREWTHGGLTNLHLVRSLHERKALMYDLSDAFIALPGGYGTLEEVLEITSWCQLGLQVKPVGLLNVAGFFQGLSDFLDHVSNEGFMSPEHRELLLLESDVGALMERFRYFQPPAAAPWLGRATR